MIVFMFMMSWFAIAVLFGSWLDSIGLWYPFLPLWIFLNIIGLLLFIYIGVKIAESEENEDYIRWEDE